MYIQPKTIDLDKCEINEQKGKILTSLMRNETSSYSGALKHNNIKDNSTLRRWASEYNLIHMRNINKHRPEHKYVYCPSMKLLDDDEFYPVNNRSNLIGLELKRLRGEIPQCKLIKKIGLPLNILSEAELGKGITDGILKRYIKYYNLSENYFKSINPNKHIVLQNNKDMVYSDKLVDELIELRLKNKLRITELSVKLNYSNIKRVYGIENKQIKVTRDDLKRYINFFKLKEKYFNKFIVHNNEVEETDIHMDENNPKMTFDEFANAFIRGEFNYIKDGIRLCNMRAVDIYKLAKKNGLIRKREKFIGEKYNPNRNFNHAKTQVKECHVINSGYDETRWNDAIASATKQYPSKRHDDPDAFYKIVSLIYRNIDNYKEIKKEDIVESKPEPIISTHKDKSNSIMVDENGLKRVMSFEEFSDAFIYGRIKYLYEGAYLCNTPYNCFMELAKKHKLMDKRYGTIGIKSSFDILYKDELVNELIRLRKNVNLSREKLAKYFGYSISALRCREDRLMRINRHFLNKYIEYFKLQETYFDEYIIDHKNNYSKLLPDNPHELNELVAEIIKPKKDEIVVNDNIQKNKKCVPLNKKEDISEKLINNPKQDKVVAEGSIGIDKKELNGICRSVMTFEEFSDEFIHGKIKYLYEGSVLCNIPYNKIMQLAKKHKLMDKRNEIIGIKLRFDILYKDDLVDELIRLRNDNGLSLYKLSQLLVYGDSTLRYVENRAIRITSNLLNKYIKCFNLPKTYFDKYIISPNISKTTEKQNISDYTILDEDISIEQEHIKANNIDQNKSTRSAGNKIIDAAATVISIGTSLLKLFIR